MEQSTTELGEEPILLMSSSNVGIRTLTKPSLDHREFPIDRISIEEPGTERPDFFLVLKACF